MNDYILKKKSTQPSQIKTCGSTFKNPFDRSELKAWQLIDKAGLREYELNGVSFSEKHANFIVNRQKDSANLIEDFGENIKKEVLNAKKTFQKYKWPLIDVTRKSVEETAASIIKIHEIYLNNVK